MDPTNNPTPNPTPDPAPTPDAEPTSPAPGAEPTPPAPASGAPEPVPGNPTADPNINAPAVNPEPVNPIIQPGGQNELAATDPIMQPEPAPEPDPVEEELKAPMKAAEPAPGSIGSAVSGPAGAPPEMTGDNPFEANAQPGQTPNVAFNDPATGSADGTAVAGVAPVAKQAGDKKNKTTLIALIAVAAVIVIVLVVVLIMQMTQSNGGGNTANNAPANDNTAIVDDEDEDDTSDIDENKLVCSRDMTADELALIDGATNGMVSIEAFFDEDDILSDIEREDQFTTGDETTDEAEWESANIFSSSADDFTKKVLGDYFLDNFTGDGDGYTRDAISDHYTSLDFTCE